MRILNEVTLKSLKENREIQQKLGGENYQRGAGIPTVTATYVQSVLENVYSGISIRRTHHKADISLRRTVNFGTERFPGQSPIGNSL